MKNLSEMNFILIKRISGNQRPGNPVVFEWWEQRGDKLFNYSGRGWCTLLSNDVIIDRVKCTSWEELLTPERIQKTSKYKRLYDNSKNKSLKIGWLEPNGKMHYCEYSDHIEYVHIVLQNTVEEVERKGWVHIYKNCNTLYLSKLTPEQLITATEELELKILDNNIL